MKKGGKIEVSIQVNADLSVQVTAREVGGKGGVRGNLSPPTGKSEGKGMENGSA